MSASRVVIRFEDLRFTVEDVRSKDATTEDGTSAGKLPILTRGARPTKEILHGVSGEFRGGDVVAVMGPSGAGKTSMLNILGSRLSKGVSSSVLFNGESITPAARKVTGFAMQKDIFFGHLTVEETLLFSAELRLPKSWTYQQKKARVDEVISFNNLQKCRHTKLGDVLSGGISGGELKRVNIANELLGQPPIMILDEPTSGLDSSTAKKIVKELAACAKLMDMAILMSVHQPSSELFAAFNQLILMMNGDFVYQGPAADALDYFAQIGYTCPRGYNIADYLMEQLTNDANHEFLLQHYEARIRYDDAIGYYMDFPARKRTEDSIQTAKVDQDFCVEMEGRRSNNAVTISQMIERLDHPGILEQTKILTRRAAKVRFRSIITINDFVEYGVVAIVESALWFRVFTYYSEQRFYEMLSLMSFMSMHFSFSAVFNALDGFPEERPVVIRERASKMYQMVPFWLSRIISLLPICMILPTVLFIVVAACVGIPLTWQTTVMTWLLLVSLIAISTAVGHFFASTSGSFKKAATAVVVVNITMSLTSGFFVPLEMVPSWMKWLKWISFQTYSLTLFVRLFTTGFVFACSPESTLCGNLGVTELPGEMLAESRGFTMPTSICIVGMIVWYIIFEVGTYLLLRFGRYYKAR